jgi:hypothetical protein
MSSIIKKIRSHFYPDRHHIYLDDTPVQPIIQNIESNVKYTDNIDGYHFTALFQEMEDDLERAKEFADTYTIQDIDAFYNSIDILHSDIVYMEEVSAKIYDIYYNSNYVTPIMKETDNYYKDHTSQFIKSIDFNISNKFTTDHLDKLNIFFKKLQNQRNTRRIGIMTVYYKILIHCILLSTLFIQIWLNTYNKRNDITTGALHMLSNPHRADTTDDVIDLNDIKLDVDEDPPNSGGKLRIRAMKNHKKYHPKTRKSRKTRKSKKSINRGVRKTSHRKKK